MSLPAWIVQHRRGLHILAALALFGLGGAWQGASAGDARTLVIVMAWTTTVILSLIGAYHFTRAFAEAS